MPGDGVMRVSMPGADRDVAMHSEHDGGFVEVLADGKMRHKSIDPMVVNPKTGTLYRHGSCWQEAHSAENTQRSTLVSKPEKQYVRRFHPKAEHYVPGAAGPSAARRQLRQRRHSRVRIESGGVFGHCRARLGRRRRRRRALGVGAAEHLGLLGRVGEDADRSLRVDLEV